MPLTQWLTRDKRDLIVGIDYDNAEVWLYSGRIVTSNSWIYGSAEMWELQGDILGSMIS